MRPVLRCAALVAVLGPVKAHADSWFVAETPAAMAVSDAQEGVFRPGAMPAVGAYLENERAAIGVRLRAGVLRNGPAPGGNLVDPGTGGLVTGSLALRVPILGGWIEGAGGAGLTGHDFVPTVEAGAGWSFAAGRVDLGPSVRYVRVISRDSMDAFGSADLVLVGLDVRFGKSRPTPIVERPTVAEPAPVAIGPIERDDDEVVERETSCAGRVGEDADPTGIMTTGSLDGCPIDHEITIVDDRIVLDERVLFEINRARVRSRGRAVIERIAALWRVHPEWKRITIEGHTCNLGTDDYNMTLSRDRAERTRAVLLQQGFNDEQVEAIGYGRTRPREPGDTEAVRERNRRVEFVIEREGAAQTIGGVP